MHRRIIGIYAPAPRSGKSTIAQHLADRAGFQILPFAGPLKRVASAFLVELGWSSERIEAALRGDKTAEVYDGVTLRQVLQTLGTEWGRCCVGPQIWVDCWRAAVNRSPWSRIVADDVRFTNEARAIRDLGGEIWAVTRPGAQGAGSHASEAGLAGQQIDRWLLNDADLESLLAQADEALR